ncbi:Mitochondrial carnitine/acylcarnitine carrier protein [Dirofilaria immitis]|nr:Mitochondrial carnitine/acylcarnitine carrier protein [Dirofilaria immitis]
MSKTNNANYEIFKNFVAGGVGGTFCVAMGHPFDTVKVRLQTMPKVIPGTRPLYTGAIDCARQTIVKEGFFALYKGMGALILGVTPLFAVYFGSCSFGKWLQQTSPDQEMTFVQNLCSGGLAGVFTTVIMVPGERIKCLLQVQHAGSTDPSGVHYSGPVDVFRKLYKQGGIRSIYRGSMATLLRDIPASAVYLATYEYFKKLFVRGDTTKNLTPLSTLVAGGLSGVANWSICIPPDVLKSRLQAAPEGKYPDGIRDVFKEIMRDEGPKALFKGFTLVMLRAFPANAACFFGFELALSFFISWKHVVHNF